MTIKCSACSVIKHVLKYTYNIHAYMHILINIIIYIIETI